METFDYTIHQGDPINRWILSAREEAKYYVEPKPLEVEVSYQFENAPRDVRYPCREEFCRSHSKRSLPYPNADIHFSEGYFPFGNHRMEDSGFWHLPTYSRRYAKVSLEVTETIETPFRLATCGGVQLWRNQEKVLSFSPFTRNREQTTEFQLSLHKGSNELIVMFDELCERDTHFYFSLYYQGETPLQASFPIPCSKTEILEVEAFLSEIYCPYDFYSTGEVVLECPKPLSFPLSLRCSLQAEGNLEAQAYVKESVLAPNRSQFVLGSVREIPFGLNAISMEAQLNGLRIRQKRFVGVFDRESQPKPVPDSLAERKRRALEFTAQYGNSKAARALAILETQGDLEVARHILNMSLNKVSQRKDCADFEIIPLLWIWKYYAYSVFEPHFWKRVRKTLLGFRYWIDEPGNDVMWYFSENHCLLFHTAELLAGQLFKDRMFINSRQKGYQHQQQAITRLEKWFANFVQTELTEWNSGPYYPIDMIGFFSLYQLAENKRIKNLAKQALDRLSEMIAVNSLQGVLSGSEGRAYTKNLVTKTIGEVAGFNWVSWGKGYLNQACAALPLYCLSDYEPPAPLAEQMLWPHKKGIYYQYSQGKDQFALLSTYKTQDYLLSTVNEHKVGQPGHQQHVLQIDCAHHPEAQIWINHPGEQAPFGEQRPSYWAGNGTLPRVVQHQNTAIALFQLHETALVQYTHAYVPLVYFDNYRITSHWIFLQSGDAYCGLYAANGLELITTGPFQNREVISHGAQNAWVVCVGNDLLYHNFTHFQAQLEQTAIQYEASHIRFDDPFHGAIECGWSTPWTVNGQSQTYDGFTLVGRKQFHI